MGRTRNISNGKCSCWCLFAIIPLILSIGIITALPFADSYQPKDAETQCREGMVLVFRTISNNYACVSESTAERWVELEIAQMVSVAAGESDEKTMSEPKPPIPKQERPNILFILTDNQGAEGLSVYGNKDVKTPNLDRLASEGILFNNVYAENGLCSPTRATIMTGLLASQHGVHNPYYEVLLDELPEGWSIIQEFRTLPQTLSNRGYETAMIGKWHLGQPWEPALGFKEWIAFPKGHTVNFWDNNMVVNDEVVEVKGEHIVDFLTDKAVEYLGSQDGSTQFYLQLNYDSPYTNPA